MTSFRRYAAILVVAAGVSRVPQLTSPHLLLDGDEAILGLMAKHLAEGREVPIFCYGQAYGLSFFEAAAGAIAFRLAYLEQIYTHLTGFYYLWTAIDPGPLTAMVAWLWYGLLAAMLIVQAWRLVLRRFLPISHVLCFSILSTLIATWVLVSAPEPRFLLPLGALLVAWVSVEAADLLPRLGVPDWTLAAVAGSVIALGALSHVEFGQYAYLWNRPDDGVRERDRLQRAIEFLESHRVRHVFSTNGLLQWQLMFYSGEAITARYASERDRYPSYVADVDRALAVGEPVAVIGYARPMRALVQSAGDPETLAIDDRYFVYLDPDRDLLSGLGFRFAAD